MHGQHTILSGHVIPTYAFIYNDGERSYAGAPLRGARVESSVVRTGTPPTDQNPTIQYANPRAPVRSINVIIGNLHSRPMSSEDRLEEALAAYNDRIALLEKGEDSDELLESYINRGVVLMMMEYRIAALSDFEEAVDLIEARTRNDIPVDLGLYVRAYENRGHLCAGTDDLQMSADYRHIAERLPQLRNGTRYFMTKDIVNLCLDCSDDLLYSDFKEEALPFLEKSFDCLKGKHDPWAKNRLMETYALKGEVMNAIGKCKEAIDLFSKAIDIGNTLFERGELEDAYCIILYHMNRSDVYDSLGEHDRSIDDSFVAIEMLEESILNCTSDDTPLLVQLCQDVATRLMDRGRIQESEKYLLKSMRYGLPEVDEAMDNLGMKG